MQVLGYEQNESRYSELDSCSTADDTINCRIAGPIVNNIRSTVVMSSSNQCINLDTTAYYQPTVAK